MSLRLVLISMALLLSLPASLRACDVCGCVVDGSGVGLLPQWQRRFAALQWQSQHFRVAMNGDARAVEDHFQSLALQIRWTMNSRWWLEAQVPYRINQRQSSVAESLHREGLGDLSVGMGYRLIQRPSATSWGQQLIVGAHIQAPSGASAQPDALSPIPEAFALGTGTWAYAAQLNYAITRQRWGLNLGTQVRSFIKKNDYDFGTQYIAQARLFYDWEIGNWHLIPSLGWHGEQIRADRLDGQIQHGTGGYGHFFAPGFDLLRENWALNARWLSPFRQSYGGGDELFAEGRLSLQLAYLF